MKEKNQENLSMIEEIEPTSVPQGGTLADKSAEVLLEKENDEAIELVKGKLDLKKSGNIIIGTLNVMAQPIKHHLKKRHERFYRDSKFHLVADIFFVLAILGLAAIFLYFYTFQPKAQIDLSTTAVPADVVSGQSGVFTIHYKNNGKVDIKSTTLSLIFTKNFVLQDVSPRASWSDQTNTFTIGDLPRGAAGSVKITGMPIGAIGTTETFNYSLNYLQNGKAVNTLGTYVFPLNSSVLSVSFSAPKQIYQNLDFGGNIDLRNNGTGDLAGEIDLSFVGSPITIKSISSDQANLVNGVIIVDGLPAGQSLPIQYEAVTAGQGTVAADLEADLNFGGVELKQAAATSSLNITVPKFAVTIVPDKNSIVAGDTVNFKLNFTNKEETMASSVSLSIMPADNATVIKSLMMANGSGAYKFNGNSIALGNLAPGQAGEIDFSAELAREMTSVNQQTGIIADINYQVNGRPAKYQLFGPKIKFLSDMQVISHGLYYSAQGDQLGVGPLPPIVDVPTDFWIFWQINNNGNELQNLTVSADVPSNVGWTNQKTVLSGDLQFGAVSHKVIWTVPDVAASGGNYRAGFEVELIPTAADAGTVPALISNIRYSATDIFTGQQISGTLPAIDANIKDDPTASGKGKVIELNIVK